ncbi:glycosyltransferase [Mongoliimonas terrestris]|uniref:glycosyltransferase n=1 Tax=Mongoliimonas terrestris TaxID=1709001 RepID=UPI00094951A8|nr:glycosyltransferase [Mongoliimonas terrestris]
MTDRSARPGVPSPAGRPAPTNAFRPGETTATVAVVIPAYKHSVLLTEAVEAVLAQVAPFGIATVIVDDGCPFPETQEIGRTYALAEPSVHYLRKPNGGLSSARNHGIAYALRTFPDLEAIYFLDADNRITPTTIASVLAFMKSKPNVDWVYPNIDKVGIGWNGNYTADYSRLLHLTFDNICEAGSMVSRKMLESGVRFDETMRQGFEDWDFWLQAIDRGFEGANYPFFGFEYRQRAESMLRDSNRARESILGYIHKKHKRLFKTDTLLAFEHEETPRYAAVGVGTYQVETFTDPVLPHAKLGLEELVRRFWAAKIEPETYGVPPFWVWMSANHRDALRRLGLLHTVLWLGEREADRANFVALRLEVCPTAIEVAVRKVGAEGTRFDQPAAWMATRGIMGACVDDPTDGWVRSLRTSQPGPTITEITIKAPFTAEEMQGSALSATNTLLATLGALRDSGFRSQAGKRWIWRSAYLPDRSRYHAQLRHAVGSRAVMPRVSPEGGPVRVGFLLPIASFGGVEKVAYAVARCLKAAGCEVHLYILGKPVFARSPEAEGVFATVNFLADDYPLWGGPNTFAGHDVTLATDPSSRTEDLIGFLSGLDVVINNQVAVANAALGALRQQGVKVLDYVHVLDKTPVGRDAGHPYLALAFEHVYDTILTCSRDMGRWLHGMGVPSAKLMHIRNAASYTLQPEERDQVLAERRRKPKSRPLNVLFLGRLDPQKGIERLYAAARDLKRRGVPIEWRVVGSDVISAGAGGSWKERFRDIGVPVVPPIHSSRDLNRAYGWADVLVLPSRWEGAPLAILEAQRLGCVPVATNVGAVHELIDHGADGLMLDGTDDGTIVRSLTATLTRLAGDLGEVERLSEAASRRGASATWKRTAEPLVRLLMSWFPDRLAAPPRVESLRGMRLIRRPRGEADPALAPAPSAGAATERADGPTMDLTANAPERREERREERSTALVPTPPVQGPAAKTASSPDRVIVAAAS